MRRIVTRIAVIAFVVGVFLLIWPSPSRQSPVVPRVHAEGGCSVASVNGTYGFFRTGIVPAGPVVGVGISTRDGNGHATARLTIRRNGVTISDLFTTPATQGTYEVDPDCAGREINPDGSVFIHFVVVD